MGRVPSLVICRLKIHIVNTVDCACHAWHVVVDLALLQEFFCMKGVEGSEVVNHGHQLGEDGFVLGMLRQEDAIENHLELVLDAHEQLGVPESWPIWIEMGIFRFNIE